MKLRVTLFAALTFVISVLNLWFGIGLALGIVARLYDGKIISITAGVACGIVLLEVWRMR